MGIVRRGGRYSGRAGGGGARVRRTGLGKGAVEVVRIHAASPVDPGRRCRHDSRVSALPLPSVLSICLHRRRTGAVIASGVLL